MELRSAVNEKGPISKKTENHAVQILESQSDQRKNGKRKWWPVYGENSKKKKKKSKKLKLVEEEKEKNEPVELKRGAFSRIK